VGLGYTAVDKLLPKKKAVPTDIRASLQVMSAFFMSGLSGLIHEYMTWAAFGSLTGCYMVFFGLHS
jgi:hypothetical protein